MTRLLVENKLAQQDRFDVSGEEMHYLCRVRRHGVGDVVEVQDIAGCVFESEVEHLSSHSATLRIVKSLGEAAPSHPVTLVMAVPKRSLMDEVVRKASELGIERLVPVFADRSVVKPGESKLTRWRKIAWESRRQARRKDPLEVGDVVALDGALQSASSSGTRLFLDPESDSPSSFWAMDRFTPPVTAMIGPEGGFTKEERALARSVGFEPVTLGSTILRIETAAIAASVLCVAMLGGYDLPNSNHT